MKEAVGRTNEEQTRDQERVRSMVEEAVRSSLDAPSGAAVVQPPAPTGAR